MNSKLLLTFAFVLSGLLTGCGVNPTGPVDVRAALLQSAKQSDPDFPDGRDLVLTHFSHIGQLVDSRRQVIYVAEQHSVTTKALSPHGQRFIAFFDKQFRYLGKFGFDGSNPLWCDGSRLFLYGDLQRVFFNTDLDRKLQKYPPGNVIDVADGFENIRVYHAKIYGSSGGLKD